MSNDSGTAAGVLTLTEFLLARIAEDEAVARDAVISPLTRIGERPRLSAREWSATMDDKGRWVIEGVDREETVAEFRIAYPLGNEALSAKHVALHDPARVLAECEAKRRIVEFFVRQERLTPESPLAGGLLTAEGTILPLLAAVYADHPDYRPEWRL